VLRTQADRSAPPEEILEKNGVDPYVFVRFLNMMAKAMIPIWLSSWIILIPVDTVKESVNGKTGLDKLTFGNITPQNQSRLWAHLIMNYIFIGEVCFIQLSLPCTVTV
jgi:hypothetical protein